MIDPLTLEPRVLREIIVGLQWLGESVVQAENVDICENGAVYLGLTMVCPSGTVLEK